MAILQVASAKASAATSGTGTVNWDQNVPIGSDRILWVFVEHAFNSIPDVIPTSTVTFNGVSLTKLAYAPDHLSYAGEELWYLINPATGTHNILVNTTYDQGSGHQLSGGSSSYTGANQSSQPDSFNTIENASLNPVAPATTVVASNCWLIAVTENGNADPTGYNGVTTLRVRGNIYGTLVDSNGSVATGSQSLSVQYAAEAGSCAIIASFAPSPFISFSVNDAVTVTESVSIQIISFNLSISVSDSIAVTDVPTVREIFNFSTSDAITAANFVQLQEVSFISVNNTVTVSESLSFSEVNYISVSDDIAVAESVTFVKLDNRSVSDSVSVAEDVQIQILSFVSTSDNVTVAESFQVQSILSVSVGDDVSIAENVNVFLIVVEFPFVWDNISVIENVTLIIQSFSSVFDNISLTESINILITRLVPNISDSVSLSEFVFIGVNNPGVVTDTVLVNEAVVLSISNPAPSLQDSVSVQESVTLKLVSFVVASDVVSLSESVTLVRVSNEIIFDTVSVQENVTLSIISYLSVHDNVTITEHIVFQQGRTVRRFQIRLGWRFADYIVTFPSSQ